MLVTNLANSSLILASAGVLAQIPNVDRRLAFYAHGISRGLRKQIMLVLCLW